MLKLAFDDELINKLAEKIADRSIEIVLERINAMDNNLPPVLTREEAKKLLKCGETKMSELLARPDFPVNRDFGIKIPTRLLIEWIERNTQWINQNTNYFHRKVV